jgi:uncharacterized protein YbcI
MDEPQSNDPLHGDELLTAVASAMVAMTKEFAGKGPSKCKAYWAGQDMLLVMLGGGFTTAEQTLFESGRGDTVQEARSAYQDSMRQRLIGVMQELVGREVVAFMNASHQDPDLTAQLFIFEPHERDHPALVRGQRTHAQRSQ